MRFCRIAISVMVASILFTSAAPSDAARWPKRAKISLESWSAREFTYPKRLNDRYSDVKCIVLTLNVRNRTDKTVNAWRANCVVKDPYNKEIFTFVANGDTKPIAGGEIESFPFFFLDDWPSDYDLMKKYNLKLIKLELRDIETAN